MEDHCNFYVIRKKRMCRMTVRPGAKYCGEHLPKVDSQHVDEESDNLQRIVCPLDPKHTCFASKLEKHLKVCNARTKDLPPFIMKNCNIPDTNEEKTVEHKRLLADVPTDKLSEIIAIIENIYQNVIADNIKNIHEVESHPSVALELNNEKRGNNTKRHLQQTSSLLNITESEKLLCDNSCFIELGAGKGHVSYYLASAISDLNKSSVLLVDKASHRHKQDNKLDKQSLNVHRIRADISDLVLSEIPLVKDSEKVVGISKHLCGVATDLALRCLINPNVIQKTIGIIIAVCCHHRCQWTSYTGKPFLEKNNITQLEFDVICGLVSWATCGSGLSRSHQLQDEPTSSPKKMKFDTELDNIETHPTTDLSNNNGEFLNNSISSEEKLNSDSDVKNRNNVKIPKTKSLGLSLQERTEIGFKAKAVLDWGRILYLREHDFDAKLSFYVEKSISPENVCIIATKKNFNL